MVRLFDKLILKIAKDILQIYNYLTGNNKYSLSRILLVIFTIMKILGMTMINIFYILSSNNIYFLSYCYFMIIFFIILVILDFYATRIEIREYQKKEEYYTKNGFMMPIYEAENRYKRARFLILISIPYLIILHNDFFQIILWSGFILHGINLYLLTINDFENGKSIFSKIYNKIKNIMEVKQLNPVRIINN